MMVLTVVVSKLKFMLNWISCVGSHIKYIDLKIIVCAGVGVYPSYLAVWDVRV